MLRDCFVRASFRRAGVYRAIGMAAASVALLPVAALGGTAVSFDRQANGQQMSDVYLDGNNQQQTYTYTWPDNANWSQSKQLGNDPAGNQIVLAPSNWSQDTYPDGDYDVSLGGNQVTGDISVSVDTLSLSGELDTLGGTTLAVTNGSLVNNGKIVVDWDTSAYGTALAFSADATISGTGTITLNNDPAQLTAYAGATVTIGSGQTVNGLGQISGTFVNNGTIRSTVAAGTIAITGTMTNNNIISADDKGTVTFNGTMTNNGTIGVVGNDFVSNLVLTGTINNSSNGLVAVGGNLYLNNVAIDGGMVWALSAGAYVQVDGTSTITNDDFRLGGGNKLDILSGCTLTFGGAMNLANDGTITVDSDNSIYGTALDFSSDVTIDGSGDILLARGGGVSQFTAVSGATVTLASSQTLHGTGTVNASIINKGTISADAPGMALDISSYGVENDNLMQANNQSTLNINNITVTNTNGQISAANQSAVVINGGTIDGGSVSATADSYIEWNNGTMSGSITLSGTQNISSDTTTTMNGSMLTNNGKIVIDPEQGIYGTALNFDANVTLNGTGEILLNSTYGTSQFIVTAGNILTIQSGQTIDGQGTIGGDIINSGTISANVSGQTLQITPSIDLANYAILSASNGANLQLTGPFNNIGNIEVAAGSTLALSSASILNQSTGTLDISGQLVLTSSTIDGGTVDGSAAGASLLLTGGGATIENTSLTIGSGNHLNINSENTLIFDGTMNLTNNGTIAINADNGIYGTDLEFNSDMTVNGAGDIVLTREDASQLSVTTGATMTLGPGQTLHGTGSVGGAIINQGTINADVNGKSLDFNSSSLENDSLMEATNQSTLNLANMTIYNTYGQIMASGQSSILINNSTIDNGVVSASTGSQITWSSATLNGEITLSGTQNIPTDTSTTMNSSLLHNNGKIVINSDQGIYGTALSFTGDATIDGSGEILLNSPTAQLNISTDHTLTVGTGQFIHGSGTISGSIVNQGTIRADVAGQTLEIVDAITNSGTLDVAGGTLVLDQGLNAAAVISQLHSGFHGGAWNGAGIISSMALAHKGTGVGYSSNGSAYTLMYTWLGDTDLNGVVNTADLTAMSSTGTAWSTGDFNYDGVVNADDFGLFMLGLSKSGGANISTVLPEPGLGILSMTIFGFTLSRGRRRTNR